MKRVIDKAEKALQDRIFAGIDDVKRYLETHACVDEYIYVILWRPIEWIIDYYAFLHSKNEGVKPADFWEKQSQLGVDKKTKKMEGIVSKEIYEAMYSLRDYRNRAVHRYDLKEDTASFIKFDLVCEDFYKKTGKKSHNHKKACDYGTQIIKNEFFNEGDAPAGEGDKKLFYSILESLKDNNPSAVTISCKMENLAQRYAKELLIEAGHTFVYKNRDGKSGIFIDDRQEDIFTYINYYTGTFKIRKSERQTRESLETLRNVRNAAMHQTDLEPALFERLKITWKKLMQEYFDDDEAIRKALEDTIKTDISVNEAIKTLQAYIELDREYYASGVFEEISNALVFFQETITSVMEMKGKYQMQLNNAKTEEEKEEIRENLICEIERANTAFYSRQNEKTLNECENRLQSLLGSSNGRIRGAVRNYLKTALLLSDMLEKRSKFDKKVDCAGACIEYTRAIELFLFESIYRRYKEYRSDQGWEHVKTIGKKEYDEDRITLGQYGPIFGIAKNWEDMKDAERDRFEEEHGRYISFCKEEMLYGSKTEEEIADIADKEYQKINQIKEQYRDRSAHRLGVEIDVLACCEKDILSGEDALFAMLLDDIHVPEHENGGGL